MTETSVVERQKISSEEILTVRPQTKHASSRRNNGCNTNFYTETSRRLLEEYKASVRNKSLPLVSQSRFSRQYHHLEEPSEQKIDKAQSFLAMGQLDEAAALLRETIHKERSNDQQQQPLNGTQRLYSATYSHYSRTSAVSTAHSVSFGIHTASSQRQTLLNTATIPPNSAKSQTLKPTTAQSQRLTSASLRKSYTMGYTYNATEESIIVTERRSKILTSAHLMTADINLRKGQFDAAILNASETLLRDPFESQAYLIRAEGYFALQNYEMAAREYQKYLKLQQPTYDTLLKLGRSFREYHAFEAALNAFNQAQTLREDDPYLYFWRGDVYEHLGDVERANLDYAQVMLLNDRFLNTFVQQAYGLFGEGNLDEALSVYRSVIKVDANNPSYHKDIALLYIHLAEAMYPSVMKLIRSREEQIEPSYNDSMLSTRPTDQQSQQCESYSHQREDSGSDLDSLEDTLSDSSATSHSVDPQSSNTNNESMESTNDLEVFFYTHLGAAEYHLSQWIKLFKVPTHTTNSTSINSQRSRDRLIDEAFQLRGGVYQKCGELEKAIADFTTSIEIGKGGVDVNPISLRSRAMCYLYRFLNEEQQSLSQPEAIRWRIRNIVKTVQRINKPSIEATQQFPDSETMNPVAADTPRTQSVYESTTTLGGISVISEENDTSDLHNAMLDLEVLVEYHPTFALTHYLLADMCYFDAVKSFPRSLTAYVNAWLYSKRREKKEQHDNQRSPSINSTPQAAELESELMAAILQYKDSVDSSVDSTESKSDESIDIRFFNDNRQLYPSSTFNSTNSAVNNSNNDNGNASAESCNTIERRPLRTDNTDMDEIVYRHLSSRIAPSRAKLALLFASDLSSKLETHVTSVQVPSLVQLCLASHYQHHIQEQLNEARTTKKLRSALLEQTDDQQLSSPTNARSSKGKAFGNKKSAPTARQRVQYSTESIPTVSDIESRVSESEGTELESSSDATNAIDGLPVDLEFAVSSKAAMIECETLLYMEAFETHWLQYQQRYRTKIAELKEMSSSKKGLRSSINSKPLSARKK